jgi:hypothetical protein
MKKAFILGLSVLAMSPVYADRGADSIYIPPADVLRTFYGQDISVGPRHHEAVQNLCKGLSPLRNPENPDLARAEGRRVSEAQQEAEELNVEKTISIVPIHQLDPKAVQDALDTVVIKTGLSLDDLPSHVNPETSVQKTARIAKQALQSTVRGLGTGTFGLVAGTFYGAQKVLEAGAYVSPYLGKAGKFVWDTLSEGTDALSNKASQSVTTETSLIGKVALRVTSAASSVASLVTKGMANASEAIGNGTQKALGFFARGLESLASKCLGLAKRIWNS